MKRLIILAMGLMTLAGAMAVTPSKDAKKGTWGFLGDNGKWVLKPKFESAEPFTAMPNGRKLSQVKAKGLIGYVDENGKLLAPGAVFESVEPLGATTALVSVKGKKGVIDYDCHYIIEPKLTDLDKLPGSEGYIAAFNGKTGMFNPDGEWVVNPICSRIDPSVEGYFKIYKGDKCGVTDRKGSQIIEPKEFTDITIEGDLWKIAKKPEELGWFDPAKKLVVLEPKYTELAVPVTLYKTQYFPVCKKDKWGVIDNSGKEVVKFKYASVACIPHAFGFLLTERKGRMRFWSAESNVYLKVNLDNKTKYGPFTFVEGTVEPDSYRKADLQKRIIDSYFPGGKMSLMFDKNGNTMFADISNFYELNGLTYIIRSDSYGYVYDSEGNLITDEAGCGYPYKRGDYALFRNIAIDKDMQIFPLKSLSDNSNFFVRNNDKWSTFNRLDQLTGEYDDVSVGDLKGTGYVNVCKNGLWGVVKLGEEVIPCRYSGTAKYDDSFDAFIIGGENKKGLVKAGGKEIFPPEYDRFELFNDSLISIYKHNYRGLADLNGKIILEPEYITLYNIEKTFGTRRSGGGDPLGLLNLWVIKKDGKLGLINIKDRQMVLPPEYSYIKPIGFDNHHDAYDLSDSFTYLPEWKGLFKVGKDDKYGIVNMDRKTIIPISFGNCEYDFNRECYYADNDVYDVKGKKIPNDPKIVVSDLHVGNQFGICMWYSFNFRFLKGKTIKVQASLYNERGRHMQTYTLNYEPDSPLYHDHDALMLTSHDFDWSWGAWDTYTLKFKFTDGKGRPIKVQGKTSITFKYNSVGRR